MTTKLLSNYLSKMFSSSAHDLHRTVSGLGVEHLKRKNYLYNNYTYTATERIAISWGPAMASSIVPHKLKKHHLNRTPYHLCVHLKENNHPPSSQKS